MLKNYRALAFMGYNRAQAEDLDKLTDYVEQGGTLILGWAHLNTQTERTAIENYDHAYPAHLFVKRLGGFPDFVADSVSGAPLMVARNLGEGAQILSSTDQGRPLMVEYRWGRGKVLLLNAREYPANEAVRPAYEAALASVSESHWAAEPSAMISGDEVETAAYEQGDGTRHYYVLAVDWFRAPEPLRHASLRLGQNRYPVELPFGVMLKIVTDGKRAAWCLSEEGEVLRLEPGIAVVQGAGLQTFCLAQNGELRTVEANFDEPIKVLNF